MSFTEEYFDQTHFLLENIDKGAIESMARTLAQVKRDQGRLFILGVGGSAGHASHAVNDFRKICNIDTYAPTDNVSEITARTNDEGWESIFVEYLKVSHLGDRDALLIFSVGGGNKATNLSVNLIKAIELASDRHVKVLGIVGRDGGYTAQLADVCIVIPPLFKDFITPHTEGLCAVIWHLLVNHPLLKR